MKAFERVICPHCEDGYNVVGWDDVVYENIEEECSYCAGVGYFVRTYILRPRVRKLNVWEYRGSAIPVDVKGCKE